MTQYFAVSAAGLEPATAAELARLGATDLKPAAGGVHFEATPRVFCDALLWLRTASRVLRPLREFASVTAEMLYSQTRRVRWEDFLDPTKTFAVNATLERPREEPSKRPPARRPRQERGPDRRERKQGIDNSMFGALKIKDAICDRLRREQGARPNVDRENPDVLVNAHFAQGRCTLSLDAVGSSLHERGYRLSTTEAPLKETLAAAIIELTGWDATTTFYDPFCGSGTLVIEAALRALRIAPGLSRTTFACQRWSDFDADVWRQAVSDAQQAGLESAACEIVGSDIDEKGIAAARRNATRAGVDQAIRLSVARAEEAVPPTTAPGVIVTNPPYGERLGNPAELEQLYQRLSNVLLERFGGWTAWLLAGNLGLARHFGLTADEKIKLYNGPIVCRLLKFQLPAPR